ESFKSIAIRRQHDRSHEALAKHKAWWAGDSVRSQITPVVFIFPTEEEQSLLTRRRILTSTYTRLSEYSTLRPDTHNLNQAFMSLVMADVERCGLKGELRSAVRAGHYRERTHREPWHSDNFGRPSVRWTAALGIGSTQGAMGMTARKDITRIGNLLSSIAVEPDGQLEPSIHEPGTLLRFMNSADIHGGPAGDGGRIMVQATLLLDT
ncbi:MAG: hypothetical protein AAB834_05720, partial [Patescibacteria group bacterium]